MKKILFISLISVLTGCQPKPDLNACWSPDTKKNFTELARQAILGKIEDSVLESRGANAKKITNEEKVEMEKALTITADTFHVVARDSNIESLGCGAKVSMKFVMTENRGTLEAKNAIVQFEIFKGEAESVYSISNVAPLIALVGRASPI